MSSLRKWWKANQVAAVTGALVLLVVAFPAGSLLKAQTTGDMGSDPCPGDSCPGVCCGGSYTPPAGDTGGDPCPGDTCPGTCCSGTYTPPAGSDPCPGDTCPGTCCGATTPPTGSNYGSLTDGAACTSQGGIWCSGESAPYSCFGTGHTCGQAYNTGTDPCPNDGCPNICCGTLSTDITMQCTATGGVWCPGMNGTAGYCKQGGGACDTNTMTCPSSTPIKCANGMCATTQLQCGQVTGACNNNGVCDNGETPANCTSDCRTTTATCPTSTPIKCANGSCATTQAMCDTMQTTNDPCPNDSCPNVCCSTGEMGQCTATGGVWCPGMNGAPSYCKATPGSCPITTPATCPSSTPIKCANGSCATTQAMCDTMRQMPVQQCPGQTSCGQDTNGTMICVPWGTPCPMMCPTGQKACKDQKWGGEYCAMSCDQTTTMPMDQMTGPCAGGPCPDGCYRANMQYCGDPWGGPGYCAGQKDSCNQGKGPEFNFDQFQQNGMCDPRDPFCQQGQEFQQFESKMDMYVKEDYNTKTINKNDASRECKNISREVKNEQQWLKDVNREFKKLDWTVQSPVLANAKSMLDEITGIFTEVEAGATACSATTQGDFEQMRDKLNYFRNELRPAFDELRPSMHVFEELKNFNKEVAKMLKDITREQTRFAKEKSPEECVNYLAEASKALKELQADPLKNIDTTNGFDGRDLWSQMEDIRWNYMDPAFQCHDGNMRTNWMGQAFEQIKIEIESMEGQVPAEMASVLEKAKGIRNSGAACYEKGDLECAQEALNKLEMMKRKFGGPDMGPQGPMGPMQGPSFGMDMEGALSSFDGDIAKIIEEKIFARMGNLDQIINSLVDQVMNRVMEQLATVIDQLSEQVAATLTKVTENITYAPAEVQKAASAAEESKLVTVEEVLDVTEDLSGTARIAVENVVDEFAGELWTDETLAELQPEVSGLVDLVQNGATTAEIVEEAQAVQRQIEEAKGDEQDKRFAEGFVPFRDVQPDQWFMGYAHVGKELGHVKGEGGTNNLNPSGELLGAHEVVIMARELGVDDDCTEPLAPVPGIVDWAKPAVCGLQKAFGADVLDVLDRPLDQPIQRVDVVELQKAVLDLPVPANLDEVLKNFSDVSGLDQAEREAVAAAYVNGIVSGDDPKAGSDFRTFRPEDGMNRAEGLKVNSIAHEVVQTEEVFGD